MTVNNLATKSALYVYRMPNKKPSPHFCVTITQLNTVSRRQAIDFGCSDSVLESLAFLRVLTVIGVHTPLAFLK